MNQEHKIVLYQVEDTNIYVNVMFKEDTFWMTQKAMADLFECTTDNISLHLKNIYKEEELDENRTTEFFSVVQNEGQRNVKRKVKCYNLNAIIAVGYRVNSKKATRFRQWTTKTLKEYITKGFVLNDDMLKTADLLEKTILMNYLNAFVKSEPVSAEPIRKLRMYLNSAVMIMIKTVR